MGLISVRCDYGNDELGEECCLQSGVGELVYRRCPVFDWEECPYGKKVKGCGTCAHSSAMTMSPEGERWVNCDVNEMQMYAPYATDCKHWEKAVD